MFTAAIALTPAAPRGRAPAARQTSCTEHGDGWARGHVEPVGEIEADGALGERERERAGDQPSDARREHPARRGGQHVDRGDEEGADGRDCGDRGDGDEAEQEEVGAARGQAHRRGAVRVEADRRPRAAQQDRGGDGDGGDRARDRQVRGAEAEQGAEQQPVHRGAGLEHVAREDHPDGERGDEQQRRALAVLPRPAADRLHAARVAERDRDAGQRGADPRGVGEHEPGKVADPAACVKNASR